MPSFYFDTSALVKRYVEESGSQWVNALFTSPRNVTIFTSRMTIVESTCAFARRMREGALAQNDYEMLITAFNYDAAFRYVIAGYQHKAGQFMTKM